MKNAAATASPRHQNEYPATDISLFLQMKWNPSLAQTMKTRSMEVSMVVLKAKRSLPDDRRSLVSNGVYKRMKRKKNTGMMMKYQICEVNLLRMSVLCAITVRELITVTM